jgi:hypothetical protein
MAPELRGLFLCSSLSAFTNRCDKSAGKLIERIIPVAHWHIAYKDAFNGAR